MTEYISKIQDENTGKIAYFKDAEARNQLKNTVKKTVIENGKLYLLKDDGTKIDTGTTLPVVENGSSVSIDDSTTSIDKTWSSDKINSQLNNIANELGKNENGTDIELSTTDKSIKGAINEVFQSASNGKSLIAQAITGKGINTSNTDSFSQMAININSIETGTTVDCDNIATTYMQNKKILFVGDSFFAGTTGNTPISTLLDNKIETVSTNIAKKGASYISDSTNCINTQLSNYINSNGIDNFDLILLSGGGNDCFFNENLAIGTFVDTETLLSSTTVLGQIQRVFEILKEKGKLKNLLYVLGNYAGNNANGLKNIPLLEAKLFPMLDAYNVPYIYFKDKYTLDDTVNQDGMHPTNTIYNTTVIPLLVPYMIHTYINSISNSNTESGGDTPSVETLSTLRQGSLTANGVKIDIVGKKITFTAQQNISRTNGIMFLVTGKSLLGGTKNSDFSSRLTDTFFNCKNGDTVGIELSNIQSTNNKATGYVALASQTGATQVIVYPQSTTIASSTLTATSCGLICAINNLSAGDTASYYITVTKNGTEIGNVIS